MVHSTFYEGWLSISLSGGRYYAEMKNLRMVKLPPVKNRIYSFLDVTLAA
jgi:hypothetical protein